MKTVEIYTDGACSGNPGPGGYGIVMIYKNNRKELSEGFKKTTNNRMEMLSVIVALENLKESCNVNLFSDSKYVVDSINKGWAQKWKKNNWMKNKKEKAINVDLWDKILDLLKLHNITFNWVKGHDNNVENNRCDLLAREAIKKNVLKDDLGFIKYL